MRLLDSIKSCGSCGSCDKSVVREKSSQPINFVVGSEEWPAANYGRWLSDHSFA
jgi:hypothetical protein